MRADDATAWELPSFLGLHLDREATPSHIGPPVRWPSLIRSTREVTEACVSSKARDERCVEADPSPGFLGARLLLRGADGDWTVGRSRLAHQCGPAAAGVEASNELVRLDNQRHHEGQPEYRSPLRCGESGGL